MMLASNSVMGHAEAEPGTYVEFLLLRLCRIFHQLEGDQWLKVGCCCCCCCFSISLFELFELDSSGMVFRLDWFAAIIATPLCANVCVWVCNCYAVICHCSQRITVSSIRYKSSFWTCGLFTVVVFSRMLFSQHWMHVCLYVFKL